VAVKYNRKSEKAPYDDGRSEPRYPYVRGEADILGATKTVYADPANYEKSFTETFNHDASFTINETGDDDKKGLTNSLNHEVREYSSGGTSSTSDGHRDEACLDKKGSKRQNFAGDSGVSAGGNIYSGAGETTIGGSKSGGFSHDQGDTYSATTGIRIFQHTGDTNIDHEGDYVNNTTGNRADLVNGEFAMNIQGGNMDIQVDSGKFRVKSGAELIVESDVTITIKVGSNVITINQAGITINAAAGKVDILATGKIKTLGTQTDVQGGGPVSVPTTFKGS
jgi:hypothetical protein